eukprot:scaffold300_cov258-Pinguiococcus_pyrenoidosus.AAC.25
MAVQHLRPIMKQRRHLMVMQSCLVMRMLERMLVVRMDVHLLEGALTAAGHRGRQLRFRQGHRLGSNGLDFGAFRLKSLLALLLSPPLLSPGCVLRIPPLSPSLLLLLREPLPFVSLARAVIHALLLTLFRSEPGASPTLPFAGFLPLPVNSLASPGSGRFAVFHRQHLDATPPAVTRAPDLTGLALARTSFEDEPTGRRFCGNVRAAAGAARASCQIPSRAKAC